MKHLGNIGKEANLITSSINDFSQTIQKSLAGQSEGMRRLNEGLVKQSEEGMRRLNEELDSSLGNLNKALTSLTEKFRTDYSNYLENFSQLLEYLASKKK